MNSNDIEQLKQSTQAVFAALYLVDVDTLSAEQRQTHQAALSAAYLAYVKVENLAVDRLAGPLKPQLAEISTQVKGLGNELQAIKEPAAQLALVVSRLDVMNQLAHLLGR